VGAPSKSP